MSGELGTMSVQFTADTSGLESGVERAKGVISGLSSVGSGASGGGGIGGFIGKVGGFVSGLASGVTGMLNFGKTAVGMGMALLAPDAQTVSPLGHE